LPSVNNSPYRVTFQSSASVI